MRTWRIWKFVNVFDLMMLSPFKFNNIFLEFKKGSPLQFVILMKNLEGCDTDVFYLPDISNNIMSTWYWYHDTVTLIIPKHEGIIFVSWKQNNMLIPKRDFPITCIIRKDISILVTKKENEIHSFLFWKGTKKESSSSFIMYRFF